jgi:hypothetical protein
MVRGGEIGGGIPFAEGYAGGDRIIQRFGAHGGVPSGSAPGTVSTRLQSGHSSLSFVSYVEHLLLDCASQSSPNILTVSLEHTGMCIAAVLASR